MRTNSSPRGADTYVARVSTCRAPCLPFFFSTRPLARAGAARRRRPLRGAPCVIRRVKPRPTGRPRDPVVASRTRLSPVGPVLAASGGRAMGGKGKHRVRYWSRLQAVLLARFCSGFQLEDSPRLD